MITRIKIVLVLAVILLSGLMFGQRPAHADSQGILDVTVAGTWEPYKIELFQVGAPYPSRQQIAYPDIRTMSESCVWYSLVTSQTYFLRITNMKYGWSRQTGSFKLTQGQPGVLQVRASGNPFVIYARALN